MKNQSLRIISLAIISLLIAFAMSASATTPQQYAPATLTASCKAVTSAVGLCTPLQLAGNSLAIGVTWQISYDTGTASAISVTLVGSNDNSTWTTLDTNTACLTTGGTGCSRSLTVTSYKYLACNVGTYTVGSTTNLTCSLTSNPNGAQAGGGGAAVSSASTGNAAYYSGPTAVSGSSALSFTSGGALNSITGANGCPLIQSTDSVCVASPPYYAAGSATTTTTVGATTAGTSVVVASASTWALNEGIYIAGAGAAGANYVGTVTAINGTTLTISPATSTTAANGTLVQHDNTVAFQAAINALSTGGNIVVPNGYYRMNAPQQTVNGLSVILAVPTIAENSSLSSNPFITIQLTGQQDPTVNLTNTLQGGVVLDTDENTGSFIGGAGASSPFTGVYLSLKNLVIRTPQNPAITAINANLVGGLHLENVIVDVLGEGALYGSVPSNSNGIGVIAPAPGSGNLSLFENLKVFGYYTGIELFDHAYLHYSAFGYDKYAILIGNGTTGAHGIGGNYVDVEQCLYGISPYNTVGGSFNVTNYDFEHDAGTFAVTDDLYDPTNLLSGALSYSGTIGSGGSPLNLAISGAVNVQLTPLSYTAINAQLGGLSWTGGSIVSDPTGGIDPNIAIAQAGQVLTVAPPGGFAAPAVVNGNGYTSTTISNFTGHKFSARILPVILGVSPSEEVYPYLAMGPSWTQNVYIYPYEGNLYFVKNDSGFSVIGSEAYNPATYPQIRIREASGTLYGETSPDGVTWTNGLGSTTVGWSYASGVQLSLGVAIVPSYMTPAYPGYAQFDQVAVQ